MGGLAFAQDADGNWGYKIGGADPVIPFSTSHAYVGSFSDSNSERMNPVTVDLKPLIKWWKDVNLSAAVITSVSDSGGGTYNFTYATTTYDTSTGILTIKKSNGDSRLFSGKFIVAKAGEGSYFI